MTSPAAVASATSQKRLDANRRNAQKSTGPRTPEGKERARFNGLKHGLTAATPVIPGESAELYQARLEAMIESMAPRNPLELELLSRVAATTWSLERASRAEAAALSRRIRRHAVEQDQREMEDAAILGQQLFWHERGPWQTHPHLKNPTDKKQTPTGWSEDPASGNNPALLVLRLERTVAGCSWLLERWNELESRLRPDDMWTLSDQFKAIRLLGKQTVDAVDDPDVTMIFMSSAFLDKSRFRARVSPADADAFESIKHELYGCHPATNCAYAMELAKRPLAKLCPPNADAARETLRALIGRSRARLKLVLARNRELAEADAAEAPDRLAFDPGPEAEKLRRYLLAAARLVNQTIKTYLLVAQSPAPEATPTLDVGEPSADPVASRTEPNTPPAQAQSAESLNPEPTRHGRPAAVRTEPNPPPDWSPDEPRTEPNTRFQGDSSAVRTEPNNRSRSQEARLGTT